MDAMAEYPYDGKETQSTRYLWNAVSEVLSASVARRVFELGCGNGGTCARLALAGYDVTGVDVSEAGIAFAKRRTLGPRFHLGSAYDDLARIHGTFPAVISLEVVEHCFYPRKFAKTVFDLLEPGGVAIISTPYHGYLKNLALAITGKMDAHFGPLWDGGHIKFWSIASLRTLLEEAGFEAIEFMRVGRIAPFAKSMVAIARRPH